MPDAKPAAVPIALKRTLIVLAGLLGIASATLAQSPLVAPIVKAAFTTKAPPPQALKPHTAPPTSDLPFVAATLTAADEASALHRLIGARGAHPALHAYVQQVPPAGAALAARLRERHSDVTKAAAQQMAADASALERLAALRGPGFDRAAIDQDVQQRQRLLDLAEHQARSGNNAELRAVANEAVPGMRRQLDRAHQAAAELARASAPQPRPVVQAQPMIGGPILEPRAATETSDATTELNRRELDRIEREAGRR